MPLMQRRQASETPRVRNVASACSVKRNLAVMIEALPAGISVPELTLELQTGLVRTLRGEGYRDGTIKRINGVPRRR